MKNITIHINNQVVEKKVVNDWELKRLKRQYNYLTSKGFSLDKKLLNLDAIDEARKKWEN